MFVLTSSPLPGGTPADVVTSADPSELFDLMEESDLGGDVHLVGGQRTLDAFLDLGAVSELGIVTVPRLVGRGVRLTTDSSAFRGLELKSTRALPDRCLEQVCVPDHG